MIENCENENLPSNWTLRRISEISERVSVGFVGITSPHFTDANNGVPLIRSQNIRNGKINFQNLAFVTKEFHHKNKKSQLKEGDVIVVRVGENRGDTCILKNEFYEANCANVVFFRPQKGYGKFVELFLRSSIGQHSLISLTTGSAQGVINTKSIAELIVPLPPTEEALEISDLFESIEGKIDLLHRQNKTLEQLAETLFRQWFVEEAEEGWEVGTLEDEFEFIMGQSPSGETLNENKEGMIFFQGRSDFGFRFPEPRVYTTLATRIAKSLDTLVSVRAPVGDINMAFEECCLGRGVAAFRYRHKPEFYSYTYYKMRSLAEQIKQFEDCGTVFGSIGKDDFKKLECIIPPNELILRFQENVKPIDDKIKSNTKQVSTLTQLRDTLLPKLMNGQVRIEN